MATDKALMEQLVDCIAHTGDVRTRPMFGEYAVYLDDKVVGFVCDNQLFVKPTAASGPYEAECEAAPPYPGAKNYWRVPEEKWNDKRWMSSFLRDTAAQVPVKKKK